MRPSGRPLLNNHVAIQMVHDEGSLENVTMFVWASRCKGSDAIIHLLSWSQTIPCAEAKSSDSLT